LLVILSATNSIWERGMLASEGTSDQNNVTAFLSCSVRAADRKLVDAIVDKVLSPMGFRCVTVGRNVTLPDQIDDAIRDVMDRVDCLIGVATVRLEASDRANPDRTLVLASPYILQESAMAHQRRIPFLIFKTRQVTLQGVTSRNLYIEMAPEMRNGRPVFYARPEALRSALAELRQRALEGRKRRDRDNLLDGVGKISTLAVGTYVLGSLFEWMSNPSCFGEFYYRNPQCSDCPHKPECKARKVVAGA